MNQVICIIFFVLLANASYASSIDQPESNTDYVMNFQEVQDSCICLQGGTPPCVNLVTNGNFAQGNLGFNSGLSLGAQQRCIASSYWVGQNLQAKCNTWDPNVVGRSDGPSNTTNFLIVDGDPNNASNIWRQAVHVVPGRTYFFSFWTVSVFPSSVQNINVEVVIRDNAQIPFLINPVPLFVSQPAGLPWINHSFSWTCPGSFVPGPTGAQHALEINHTAGSAYTDFGIDDICFAETTTQDTCCTTLEDFCQRVDDAVSITVDNDSCKATVNIGNLSGCDYIEYIDWGPQVVQGPFSAGQMSMFVYPGSGTYEICYSAIELDTAGFICFEKLVCDTINIMCRPCCTDSIGFFNAAANVQTNGTLGDCMIQFNATGLDSCMKISYIWGDIPRVIDGPHPNNTQVSHTYAGPSTYNVCYLIQEFDEHGNLCWTYEKCEDVLVLCDSCRCGEFTDMYIRTGGVQSQIVECGGDSIPLACPQPGNSFVLTGLFQCSGSECPDDAPMSWTLSNGTNSWSGTTSANPYFAINLLPTYFTQAGIYTLTIFGQCGISECPCVVQFIVDCPELCPCEPDDLQAFSTAVDKGFAQTLYPNSCNACFSPIALSDCETVEWHIGNTNTPPVGTSVGNQRYCHQFSVAGTFNVIMVVTRLRPDGSLCEVFTKSQPVTVSCLPWPDCNSTRFPNPGFSEGALPGILSSGGRSSGWTGLAGEPAVVEGFPGSYDGWTIRLLGNYDSMDVLTSNEPICLQKSTGMLSFRHWGDPHENLNGKHLNDWQGKHRLYRGGSFSATDCAGPDCYELASIQISAQDTGWVEIQIPFDLSDWNALDSCGGLMVRPAFFVTNDFGSNQADGNTLSQLQIDNFCFDGMLVGIRNLVENHLIHSYPNPTSGDVNLHFDAGIPAECKIEIIDMWGRTMIFESLIFGAQDYSLSLRGLPSGTYTIKVRQNGVPVFIEKVVKH